MIKYPPRCGACPREVAQAFWHQSTQAPDAVHVHCSRLRQTWTTIGSSFKVALALSKDLPGIDFINGMYEVFKSDVETRTNGALTIEIIYGGALGNPISRMNQMRNGVVQMSDASDGNYATVYPDIQVLNIPYLFATEQDAWTVLDRPLWQKLAAGLPTTTE